MSEITGNTEGTRFATDVQIYDPLTQEILASVLELVGLVADLTERVETLEAA